MNPEDILLKYGLPGVFIIILIVAIRWGALFLKELMNQHRNERDEWRKSQERRDEDYNRNMNNNTNVLSGLKTLLENNLKK